jgi:signal transduction histidine kinase/ActR/RegA family two-component response regulator
VTPDSPNDYREIFQLMDQGGCLIRLVFDQEGRAVDYVFLDVNDSYERQTGLHGARGRRMQEIAPAQEQQWLKMYEQIGRTGESRRFDFADLPKDRWYEGYAYRVDAAEQKIAVIIHDTTERHRRDRELTERTRLSEQQVAMRTQEVAHVQEELQAMANELTLAEQHERKRLASELHEDLAERLLLVRLKLSQIHQEAMLDGPCEKLLKEADKVLTRALAYTHTVVADLSPLVLQDLGLSAAVTWLADRMEQQGLAVTVQATIPDEMALPEAHAVFVFQSVRELLMNVLKHAKCRGAAVRMAARTGQLQVEVQDEGVGFAGECADSSKRPSKFGLINIKERTTALGGRFEIDSRLQEGTKVTLTLPLGSAALEAPAQLDEEAKQASSQDKSKIPGGIVRVVLVDDHAMVRQGLKSVLDAYADMKVVGEAADGEEALKLASELLPAVVLMDINMPIVNGIEATRRIKAQHPHIQVIGLSVDADGHNQGAMLEAGAYSLMTKEAAVEQLYTLIYEAVKPGVTPFPPLRATQS